MSNAVDSGEARFFSEDVVEPPVVSHPVVSGRPFLIDVGLVAVWVLVTDWLLYQVGTFLSWGLLLGWVVLFLALMRMRTDNYRTSAVMAFAITLLGAKLIWSGSLLQIACGLFLAVCYAMALAGCKPYLPEVLGFVGSMFIGAFTRLRSYRVSSANGPASEFKVALSVVLPVVIVSSFVTLFVLANPDLASNVAAKIRFAFDSFGRMLTGFHVGEGVLWLVSGFLMLGLLYPASTYLLPERKPLEFEHAPTASAMYVPFRNTLLSVIVLFAIYLVFEFSTLWFREFPEDFYYAGYAHQGAFWLTVALALAIALLSVIFRGEVLADRRLAYLKRLALIWSIENLLLSVAVYNRLLIYIDFNGMTRMRVIGLLGITSVVIGFALVVWKFYRDRGFIWVIHRQLWVPALAVMVYAILPIDWIVNRYNAAQVRSGNLAPSVQIVAHEVTAEGVLPLFALVECDDQRIRDGVRAILAMWLDDLESPSGSNYMRIYDGTYRGNWQSKYDHRTPWLSLSAGFSNTNRVTEKSWSSFQLSTYLLEAKLKKFEPQLEPFMDDPKARDKAIDEFFEFAYRWY